MNESWHIISNESSTLPKPGQIVYCCIADGVSISTVRPISSNLKYFEDLLYLHPKWKILWRELPPLPEPPSLAEIFPDRKEEPHGKHPC